MLRLYSAWKVVNDELCMTSKRAGAGDSGDATRETRAEAGKALRARLPPERLADLALPAHRDPLAVLADTDKDPPAVPGAQTL